VHIGVTLKMGLSNTTKSTLQQVCEVLPKFSNSEKNYIAYIATPLSHRSVETKLTKSV
jgi:hypothetical protein